MMDIKSVKTSTVNKYSIFICLIYVNIHLFDISLPQTYYKDVLHRNFSKIDAPKIGSWNESLSVFKLRYLEEYVTDWNR